MYNFDVVFLILSSGASEAPQMLWRLHDAAADAGLHTSIATSPAEVRNTAKRLRVVVVDACTEGAIERRVLKRHLETLNNARVVMVKDLKACKALLEKPGAFGELLVSLAHAEHPDLLSGQLSEPLLI